MRHFRGLVTPFFFVKFESMKHISILVPKGAILGSLEGTRQLFTQVNHFFRDRGLPLPFEVQLVGLTAATALTGGLFTSHNHRVFQEVKKTDLIIVPAFDGDIEQALEANGAKVCSLAPGVIDTDMQVQLRSADAASFPDVGSFRGMKDQGALTSPEEAARRVLAFLAREDFGREPVADVRG